MSVARLALALNGLLGILAGCKEGEVHRSVPAASYEPDPDERAQMVAEQLRARDIHDERVLAAMGRVPRHRFVDAEHAPHAYEDRPLPIGHAQTISQPFVVAFMTQALALDGSERVLEIGTGSGYQAAVLGELAREVWSIELIAPLGEQARSTLAALGYDNVHVRVGDGYQGWPEEAPFDAILVTAAPDHVPQPLLDQLAPGGRMIVPVGTAEQELILVRREGERFTRESILPVRFVPLLGPSVSDER